MTPEDFIQEGAKTPDDLIGKAQRVAKVFCGRAKSGDTKSIKLLCYGDPGIGKSATCKMVANTLVEHSSSIRHISAASLSAEQVRDWLHDLRYSYDNWNVYWIEEVDAVNPAVEVLLLQFLDELPAKHAALFTSNEQMSGISDRFQSRTQAIHFERPSVDEVEKFLLKKWPALKEAAGEIAEANNGDVRASLNDAQMHLDTAKYKTS